MTSDKTQGEGNRLIAEFDGWQSNKYHNLPNKLHKMESGEEVGIAVNQLEYHSSWDAIMPVWNKYRNLHFKDDSVDALHKNYIARLAIILAYGDIEEFFIKMVIAIKWYKLNLK